MLVHTRYCVVYVRGFPSYCSCNSLIVLYLPLSILWIVSLTAWQIPSILNLFVYVRLNTFLWVVLLNPLYGLMYITSVQTFQFASSSNCSDVTSLNITARWGELNFVNINSVLVTWMYLAHRLYLFCWCDLLILWVKLGPLGKLSAVTLGYLGRNFPCAQ